MKFQRIFVQFIKKFILGFFAVDIMASYQTSKQYIWSLLNFQSIATIFCVPMHSIVVNISQCTSRQLNLEIIDFVLRRQWIFLISKASWTKLHKWNNEIKNVQWLTASECYANSNDHNSAIFSFLFNFVLKARPLPVFNEVILQSIMIAVKLIV